MTGAVLALAGAGAGSAGGVVVPGALSWTNIFDFGAGSTNYQTLSAITVPISISASSTGAGLLHYIKNGTVAVYTGALNVSAGDTLAWLISNSGATGVSGTVTVFNQSNGGATLATFTYTVKGGM